VTFVGDLERLFASSLYPLRVPLFVAGLLIGGLVVRAARRRGWLAAARAHAGRSTLVLAPILAVAVPLSWYLASPLFITTRIDEAPPVEAGSPAYAPGTPLSIVSSPTVASASAVPSAAPSAESSAVSTSRALAERHGTFHGEDDFHFGRGTARLFGTPDGVVLRFEGFEVRNGPDLYVYLSPASGGYAGKGNLELGRLKASQGNQNYRLPAGTDPSVYRSVVIWCKQFAVQFAVATLKAG
jgi:Electron transfer DM13